MEPAIRFENVSKRYYLGKRRAFASYLLPGSLQRWLTRNRHGPEGIGGPSPNELWALREVSFEVRPGEMLGIVGPNGAGKTTTLSLLAGITAPTSGRIDVRGRVGALIQLGAGFHPELTGRENVYLNASILGLKKAEVAEIYDDIVKFAELGQFMDTPIKRYSSGMYARLGFAVAVHIDPDILLVDEVLAVGDVSFQEKCMRRMDDIRRSDKAVVFVTHSLYQVEALCDRALWLDHGRVMLLGSAGEVVRAFLDTQERKAMAEAQTEGRSSFEGRITAATRAYFDARKQEEASVVSTRGSEDTLLEIERVELLDSGGVVRTEFPFGSSLAVRIRYYARRRVERPLFNLRFLHKGHGVLEASMLIDGYGPEWIEGRGTAECHFQRLPLTPKVYEILLFVRSAEGIADIAPMRTCAQFRVTDEGLDQVPLRGPMAVNHLRQGSPVYVPRTWRFYSGPELTCILESNHDEHR